MRTICALAFCLWLADASAQAPAPPVYEDDDPQEYRDREDVREAYRRGFERGFDRGYRKGMAAAAAAPAPAPPPPPPPVLGPIRVAGAFYGTLSRTCDATRYVTRQADGKKTHSFKVHNEMCGDPARGERKSLEVRFRCGEVSRTASAREHQTIYLSCL